MFAGGAGCAVGGCERDVASNEQLASASAALSAAVFAVCAVRDEHAAQVAKVEAAFAVRRRRVRRQSRKRTARSRLVVLMRLWQALVQTFLRYLWDAELEALMRLWDSHVAEAGERDGAFVGGAGRAAGGCDGTVQSPENVIRNDRIQCHCVLE